VTIVITYLDAPDSEWLPQKLEIGKKLMSGVKVLVPGRWHSLIALAYQTGPIKQGTSAPPLTPSLGLAGALGAQPVLFLCSLHSSYYTILLPSTSPNCSIHYYHILPNPSIDPVQHFNLRVMSVMSHPSFPILCFYTKANQAWDLKVAAVLHRLYLYYSLET